MLVPAESSDQFELGERYRVTYWLPAVGDLAARHKKAVSLAAAAVRDPAFFRSYHHVKIDRVSWNTATREVTDPRTHTPRKAWAFHVDFHKTDDGGTPLLLLAGIIAALLALGGYVLHEVYRIAHPSLGGHDAANDFLPAALIVGLAVFMLWH